MIITMNKRIRIFAKKGTCIMRKWMKQHKRKLVAILTAALVCTSVQLPAVQATELNEVKTSIALSTSAGEQKASTTISGNWTDNLTAQPAGYVVNGNTITISSADGLAWLSVVCNGLNGQTANTFADKTIKLDADIDLAGKYWVPIGIYGGTAGGFSQFCGTFDGQGHTISNMSVLITAEAQLGGLFGKVYSNTYTGASVKNLHMESPSVVRDLDDGFSWFSEAGCVAGRIETGNSYPVTIENISVHNGTVVSNPNNNTAYTDYGYLGGIVGLADRGYSSTNNWHINNCFFQGTITNGYSRGGILGMDYNNAKAVENCYYIAENVPYGNSESNQEKANLGTSITFANAADGEYTWKLDTANGKSHNHIWQQDLSNSQSLPRVGTDSEKRVYQVTITGVDDTSLSTTVYSNPSYTIPAYRGVTYKDISEVEISGQQTLTQDTTYKAYGTIIEAMSAKLQLTYEQKGTKLTITARITNEDGSAIVGTLTESLTLYKGADETGEVLEAKPFANGKMEVSFEIDVTEWPVEEYNFYVSYPGDLLVKECNATVDVKLTGEAAVGEMEYMTVQKAFDAAVTESAVEKTVTLLKDIRVENAVVLDRGQVTLDTNGYTLSGSRCMQVTGDAVFTLNGEKNAIVSKAAIEADTCAVENYGSCIIRNALVRYRDFAIDNEGICTAQAVEIVSLDAKGTAVNNKGIFVIEESSMHVGAMNNTGADAIYNTGSCVVSGSSLEGSVLLFGDDLIDNEGDMVIANSRLKAKGEILYNIGKLNIESSILETEQDILDNMGEAVMKDCVGKGSIVNSGEELSVINCNITSLSDVIVNYSYPDSKVVIENSALETLGNATVIEENVSRATGTSVMEIKNSSLIAPASGYAIAEPEPTGGANSATGQGVAPDVFDKEGSEEAEEEDDTTVEVKYILENALIFGACDSPYSKGLEYTAWGNVSLPKSLTIPAGKTFTVKDKGVLTIPSGMELTNNGTLLLDGELRGDGLLSGTADAVFKISWFTIADVTGIKPDGYDYKGSAYTLVDGLEDITIAAAKVIMGQTFAVDTSEYAVSYKDNVQAGDAAKIVWTKELVDGSEDTIEKTFTINKISVENPEAINKAYEHSIVQRDCIDVADLLPEDCGDVSYKVTTTGNIHYVTAPAIEDGILSYAVDKDIEAVTGMIQVEVTMQNYENVVVTVSLTRTPCSHGETVIRNAVEPEVGKAGYTGDTYCVDCGELLVTGEAIDALEPTPGPTGTPEPGPTDEPTPGPTGTPEPTDTPGPGPTDEPTPEPNESPEPSDDVMKGDVDGNGKVELPDAQMALKMALKIIAEPTGQQVEAADVDGKVGVTLSDAQLILKYALKIINKFE